MPPCLRQGNPVQLTPNYVALTICVCVLFLSVLTNQLTNVHPILSLSPDRPRHAVYNYTRLIGLLLRPVSTTLLAAILCKLSWYSNLGWWTSCALASNPAAMITVRAWPGLCYLSRPIRFPACCQRPLIHVLIHSCPDLFFAFSSKRPCRPKGPCNPN